MSNKHRRRVPLLPFPPLLISESNEEFERFRDGLYQELKPAASLRKCTSTKSPSTLANFTLATLQGGRHQLGVSRLLSSYSLATHASWSRRCTRLDLQSGI